MRPRVNNGHDCVQGGSTTVQKSTVLKPALKLCLVVLFLQTATAQEKPKPFDLIEWNGGKMVYGADYYPEHWEESQWTKDAEMMQAAGFNFVRLGEFAWVKMETLEGKFDFAWLDRAIKVLNAHGIKVVLGTPTASPPAWLYAKYPDIAATDENGVRYRYGSRRNICVHSANYLAATTRIVTAIAQHYKDHSGVIGWQIDNELGDPRCYDATCRAAFQNWCRAKFKTLPALNKAWGTIFWGHTYGAWSEIPLPWNTLSQTHNPSMALDHRRFHSAAMRDYLKFQIDLLRKISPGKAITHNDMGLYDGVDYYQMNTPLDFVSWDNYPMMYEDYSSNLMPGMAHDLMRGSKNNQNFLIMEEQGGLPGWSTFWGRQAAPGLYRAWAYQAIAHGADGICFFRWRTSRYGTEQYWQGILDQDSYPDARYQVASQMGKELKSLAPLLQGSKVVSQVAMLISPDTRWAFHIQPLVKEFDYYRQAIRYYGAFRRTGMNVDAIFPQNDFSAYKIIVAPSLFVVDNALVEKLSEYVKQGGVLILSYRSGVKDENNVVTNQTLPGPLAELAGVAIHDFDPQTNQEQAVTGRDGVKRPARVWFDILTPTTSQPILTYTNGYYAGQAAMTANKFGKGRVYYVGTELAPDAWLEGAKREARGVGIPFGPELPEGVEYATRTKNGKQIIFLMNYGEKPQVVSMGRSLQNAITGAAESHEVEIPAYDVKVLVEP